jgi:hypothetical protein
MANSREYVPTPDERQAVERIASEGHGKVLIARAIGVSRDTLRKHFAEELLNGHAQHRREVIAMLFASAERGNVSAMIRLEKLTRAAGARDA